MKTKKQFILMTFLVLLSRYSFGQGGLLGNIRPPGGNPLGWTGGVAGSLEIRNDFTGPGQPINFFTNATFHMALTPLGDLNIITAQRRYQIGGNNILWHNGFVNDIFVGVGAGNATF